MANCHSKASHPLADIEMMITDYEISMCWIVMTDGKTVSAPLDPSTFNPSSAIVKTRYVPRTNRLFMETNRGDIIEIELPTLQNPAPTGERPVVYLDQRDWNLLANVLFEPNRVHTDNEYDAAMYLITLARDRKIILPMSFAHLGETTWWRNTDRRYNLALTLAQLSRGWQMRYPIDVWQYELHQTFASRFHQEILPSLDVFTLDGCSMESKGSFQELTISSAGFPAEIESVARSMICMTSYIDTILAPEASSRTLIPEWVDSFQLITDELAKAPTTSEKHDALRIMLLKEIKLEVVAETAIQYDGTPSEIVQWVKSNFDTDVRAMRCFGLWSDIYRVKHLNPKTKWSTNDLVDMFFLTCAAGYADYVLGERSATSHINQAAKRLGKSIKVYSLIDDLVLSLKDDGL